MRTFRTLLLLALACTPLAHAEPPVNAQIEISFLLGFVDGSGCEFYRNGTWYASTAAQEHLRDKYRYLVNANMIVSAEDFIDKAATSSSFSGQPYQVRCGGHVAAPSNTWLREELARLRTL